MVLLARLQQALSMFFSPKHSECLQKFGFELLTVLQSKARRVLWAEKHWPKWFVVALAGKQPGLKDAGSIPNHGGIFSDGDEQ